IGFFTYLGEYNDYAIYKTKEDKVTLSEVVFAFNSLKIKFTGKMDAIFIISGSQI
ncbi:transmembrane regulator, partial [Salmonella enterica subsp. enterica serovar Heidelberg str. 90-0318]